MPCINRRGCMGRFRDRLGSRELFAIIMYHGSCQACAMDVTDEPRFRESAAGTPPPGSKRQPFLIPYCPACYEERWPTGAEGPFERGKPQAWRLEAAG